MASKKLNSEQLTAIKHDKGPLLIIAGAGTGKTTVIVEKIKYLIQKGFAKPSEILALTFTEKAASEMESRVEEVLPYGYLEMWISTFHSFCDRVLKEEALNIGLDSRYRLLTEAESVQLLKDNLFKLELDYFRPLGNPTKFLESLLKHFSRLQDEDISPKEYQDWVERKLKAKGLKEEEKIEISKWKELSSAYRAYDEIKTTGSLMDFGDLIVKTLKLFRERPNILKKYQKRFKYILVDEFQDTNFAQNQLVKLIAGKNGNLTVVGDDDQSIYRFRGAAVSNIIQFKKDFPKAKVVVLTKNYRSTQEILDKAYVLIQNNNPDRLEAVEKIDKKLIAVSKKKGEKVTFIKTKKAEDEAEKVAQEISRLVKEEGYSYSDIAILVRANNHADSFIRALSRHGLPYQFLGPGKLFRQPEVIDLISYLKVLDDVSDSVSFYRLLTLDHFDISGRDLALIGSFAKKKNLSLFEACEKVDEISVSVETKEKVKKILEIIKRHLGLLGKDTAGQILYYFLEDTGLLKKLVFPDTPGAQSKAANIAKFFEKIKNYETNHQDASVRSVVNWLDLSSELGESPLAAEIDYWSEGNAVNILTVHSAKGLEFPVVFLVNLVVERFPSRERSETIPIPDELIKEILPKGDYHLEEERRLFYVGMTRAKERLYLTAASFYGDAKREKKLSPFVIETLGSEAARVKKDEEEKQLSLLDYAPLVGLASPQKEKLFIDYLSYSQIESFKTCPLHYKLKYILKVPTPPSASQSFGTSIHLALRNFYRLAMKSSFAFQDKKKLIEVVLDLFEKNWIQEGYMSKSHENKFFEKGKRYLKEYILKQFNSKVKTVLTEETFVIPLNTNYKEIPLKIGGRIDRVDILDDGRIEIVDYKTGANVPTQKQIDKDLQMSFYALAATTLREVPFGKKPEEVVLTFYYFEDGKKISTVRSAKQLEEVKNEIFKIRDEIENSDFECSGSFLCKNCEFKVFCSPKV